MEHLHLRAWDPHSDRALVEQLMRAAGVRTDANNTVAFSRELEAIIAQPFEVAYPAARAREFIPIRRDAGPGARTVTHTLWDMHGDAKVIGSEGNDIPLVEVTGAQSSSPLVSLATGYRYTFQDLREAIMTGRPIDTMRAAAARRIMELRADRLAALGDTTIGLVGFLKNTNAQTITAANGTWTLGTTTADEMLEDCFKLLIAIPTNTQETAMPNVLILGTDEFHILSTTAVGSGNPMTALALLKKNWQEMAGEELTVAGWTRCDLANSTDNGPRAVAYRRDPMFVFWHVPMEFTSYAPQPKDLSFTVPCEMRVGSVDSPFPKSIAYMDGL